MKLRARKGPLMTTLRTNNLLMILNISLVVFTLSKSLLTLTTLLTSSFHVLLLLLLTAKTRQTNIAHVRSTNILHALNGSRDKYFCYIHEYFYGMMVDIGCVLEAVVVYCSTVHTAAISVISKALKQPKRSSAFLVLAEGIPFVVQVITFPSRAWLWKSPGASSTKM